MFWVCKLEQALNVEVFKKLVVANWKSFRYRMALFVSQMERDMAEFLDDNYLSSQQVWLSHTMVFSMHAHDANPRRT
jgi:hypothetical protein